MAQRGDFVANFDNGKIHVERHNRHHHTSSINDSCQVERCCSLVAVNNAHCGLSHESSAHQGHVRGMFLFVAGPAGDACGSFRHEDSFTRPADGGYEGV
jgi:hypothetical protein